MEQGLICKDKFIFKHNTICIPVLLENLPNNINLEGNDFVINSFLHVSLVCIGRIIERYNISIPDFADKILNDFCEFSELNEVKLISYENNFRFATRDDLKSIIVMCKVSNLDKFFELINKKYELNIKYPPTHVTLYTLPNKFGIFLIDSSDIKNVTKPIPNPIGQVL